MLVHAVLLHWFNNIAIQPKQEPEAVFSIRLSQIPAEAQTTSPRENTATRTLAAPKTKTPKVPKAKANKTLVTKPVKSKATTPKNTSKTAPNLSDIASVPTRTLTSKANQTSSQKPDSAAFNPDAQSHAIANSQIQAASEGGTASHNNQPSIHTALCSGDKPDYPHASRLRGEAGRVFVAILVSADGDIETIELQKSSGFARLDRTALNAVRNWHCQPAIVANKPSPAWIEQSFLFGLVD